MARNMRRVPTYYQDIIDIIGSNPGHVIGSTACLGGQLPAKILSFYKTKDPNDQTYIYAWCNRMKEIFGEGNFYLEMQPSSSCDQKIVNSFLCELSKELNIPYIITTDSHYLKKEDANIHEAYLNSQDGDREVKSFYASTYMMSTEEIAEYMTELTSNELQQGFVNIQEVFDKCEEYSLKKPLKIPQLPWKTFDIPSNLDTWCARIPEFTNFLASDYIGDRELVKALIQKLESNPLLQNQPTYDEVNACLEMTRISSDVNKAHWSAYYLNLQRIIDECWKAGTLIGPGRGSGVGFILLYLLDITQINPLWETTKCFRWRFLNPERVSVLDVDVDIEGRKRSQVLTHLREVYGNDRVANVATFGTEKSKSAILTACRGLGIDIDIASYLSSMVKAERGILQTLDQTFYGDEEAGIKPNKQFVFEMTNNYPEVWEVAHRIEGLISRYGIHAGGVVFVDEDFTESTALMRAPDGTLITQFDLHDDEKVSLIKYDLLSVEALDKIHICLDLLGEQGYIEEEPTLKQTYEKIIGVYNLERKAPQMWQMVWEHKINSLFQMEQQSGIQGIALAHPSSIDDLATLNSVIRLMATEKGAEQPLNKFARFKANIQNWYDEMNDYGLTKEEQKLLEPILLSSSGICESQEGFMQLVQIPECGGFSLTWADRLRKSIAKKNPAEYEQLTKEFFDNAKEKNLSKNLCNYVWNVLVATSRGYGFNKSHTLAYSIVALQEMNLAYHFPIIFWNCACLISDSAGTNEEESENKLDYEEPVTIYCDLIPNDDDNDDNDDEDDDEENATTTKKKKKASTTDYGKISTAINKMKESGVIVSAPDINKSGFTFVPNAETNTIIYGLKGITKIGEELVSSIIANRPYTSIEDFTSKVKINKTQVINLIKAGAFDVFGDRVQIMGEYISSISDQKKDLNLRNMQMLIEKHLLPEELDWEIKIFNFNKYIKKNCKDGVRYRLEGYPLQFYTTNFDVDDVTFINSDCGLIDAKDWDKRYSKLMDKVRNYIKANKEDLLLQLNEKLYNEVYDKYCLGTLSKWEMESISYYSHPHELSVIPSYECNWCDFNQLPEEPVIEKTFTTKDGKEVPLYKINRIAGTILEKNKNKKTLTLLTTSGVVTVKVFGDAFIKYDKQISEKDANGKKHVLEKSMIARGNIVIVTGIRRGDFFMAKKYKYTPYHLIERISKINTDGTYETETRE